MSDAHMPLLSSPAQPLETHTCDIFMDPLHLTLGLSLYLLPSFSPSILSFPKSPPSHDVPQEGKFQFCHFRLHDVSAFICYRAHLFTFLSSHGICRTLLQLLEFLSMLPFSQLGFESQLHLKK